MQVTPALSRSAVFAAALLLTVSESGCELRPSPAPPSAAAPSIPFEAYRLENGLTVILHQDHRLPLVAVNLWYHVGSKDEVPGRSGFAHLFEHLMFMGTRQVPEGGFDRIMERHGGANNATTSQDRTNYFETGPANLLQTFLYLEADRLRTLGQDITQEALDRQREVVRNERRQRTENEPYGKVDLVMWPLLYPEGHPYHQPVIGSHEDLERASLDDVRSFFASFYVPSNATLAVAGDFDAGQAKKWVRDYFAAIPPGAPPRRAAPAPAALERSMVRTVPDRVELPRTHLIVHSPASYAEGDADLDVLASILGEEKSGRLYRRLVYEKPLAQDVEVAQWSALLGSVFVIQATARPGVDLDAVEAEIEAVLRELPAQPPTPQELERARNGIETLFWRSLESVGRRADLLNRYQFHFGDPGAIGRDLARYARVTSASVKRWLERTVLNTPRLTLRVVPEGDGSPPAIGPAAEVHAPAPAVRELPGGIRLWHFEAGGVPLLSLSAVLTAGSVDDPEEKEGLAALTAAMLKEGAGSRDALALAEALDGIGATLSSAADREQSAVTIAVLDRHLDAALDIFVDVIRRPRFAEPDWDRIRQLWLNQLAQESRDAFAVANRISQRCFFGAGHPYGRAVSGTRASVAALSIADVRDFYARHYRPGGLAIVSAGAIGADRLAEALAKRLEGWTAPGGAPAPRPAPALSAGSRPRLVVANRPQAVQTVVRILSPGIARRSDSYLPLSLANVIFGGSFTSRLNLNLREAHGYTYGARSVFSRNRGAGAFVAAAAVQTPVTGESLVEFLREYRRIAEEDFSAEEIDKARSTLRQNAVESFETLAGTVRLFSELLAAGLPPDEAARELEGIRSVPAEAIRNAAREAIDWEKATIALVGDVAAIEKELQEHDALKSLPILVVDEEGNPAR
jgi:predicted Zn-dependent peptidase